jgi:hypothetical protein
MSRGQAVRPVPKNENEQHENTQEDFLRACGSLVVMPLKSIPTSRRRRTSITAEATSTPTTSPASPNC